MHTLVLLTHRLSAWLNQLAEWMLSLVGMAMALVIGLQVLFRYGFNNSLFWSEELGRLLLIWLTFLGASVAYRRGAHIGLDVLAARLGPGARRAARVAALTASLLFFAGLAWWGAQFAHFSRLQGTTTLGVSKLVPFVMAPVGGALISRALSP